MPCIEVSGLRKTYGSTVALDGIDLVVEEGRILGLVGPNAAGKSTALHALVGLIDCEGSIRVLGKDPRHERHRLMNDVSFIADVAVLPRWIRVRQLLDYVAGVHPRFDRAKAEGFLARGQIRASDQVRKLSKGTVTQLHLAVIMAIDSRLLVLDEPTLGLDPLARKKFYDALIQDYFDHTRTIVVSTNQIDEIQDVLTDFAFLDGGRIVLAGSMDAFESRYAQVRVQPEQLDAARALGPIHERDVFGQGVLMFDGADRDRLERLGEVRTPTLGDLFVAVMEGRARSQEVVR